MTLRKSGGTGSSEGIARIELLWPGFIFRRHEQVPVLGLRFFACDGCDTVYADIEEPPRCRNCGGETVDELGSGTQAAEYFTPSQIYRC